MPNILVATDGSEHADKALEVACDLAARRGAGLKILHVRMDDKEPSEMLGLLVLQARGGGLLQALQDAAAAPEQVSAEEIMSDHSRPHHPVAPKILEEIGQMVLADAEEQARSRGLEAEVLPIAACKPAQAILEAAAAHDVGTIVMGSRGLGEMQAMIFGSVSQEVCRNASCSCIMVT